MSPSLTLTAWSHTTAVSALVSTVLLGGCALLPDAQPRAAPTPIERYDSARALAAPNAQWPSDAWWTAYSDAQLDALVNAALRGAPSLAVAQARHPAVGREGAERVPVGPRLERHQVLGERHFELAQQQPRAQRP